MDTKMMENAELNLYGVNNLRANTIADPSATSIIDMNAPEIDIYTTKVNLNGDLEMKGHDLTGVGDLNGISLAVIEGTTASVEKIVPPGVANEYVTVLHAASSTTLYAEDIQTLVFFGSVTQTYYSLDFGVTRATTDMANIGRVVITYGNNLFVAVGVANDEVFTSVNGINWTAKTTAGFRAQGASAYFKGLYVFSTDNVTNRVASSPDGVNWTLHALSVFCYNFAQSADILVGSGTAFFSYSHDGFNWIDTGVAAYCRPVCYDVNLNRFIAMSNNVATRVYYSPDGMNWYFEDTHGVVVNTIMYVSEYKMYYISRNNLVTGGFGMEYSSDPLTVPFRTRAQHDVRSLGSIYSIGYMADIKRFWIDHNSTAWNYSIIDDLFGVTKDMICADMQALTLNGIKPSGGIYSGTADGATVTGAGAQSLIPLFGVGSLSLPPNALKVGDAYRIHLSGDFPVSKANTILELHFDINGSVASIITIDLENALNTHWELNTDWVLRTTGATGSFIANSEFTFNKSALKDFNGTRSVQTGAIDTTVMNTLNVTATMTVDTTTTMKTRIMYIREQY